MICLILTFDVTMQSFFFVPPPPPPQAHSCVEKAGMIGFVKMRQLEVDDDFSLRGHVLEHAIEVSPGQYIYLFFSIFFFFFFPFFLFFLSFFSFFLFFSCGFLKRVFTKAAL